MLWIQNDFGMRKPTANQMIESRSIHSQRFHVLVTLTTTQQQHMCVRDKNQLLKSHIILRYYKFLERLLQTT